MGQGHYSSSFVFGNVCIFLLVGNGGFSLLLQKGGGFNSVWPFDLKNVLPLDSVYDSST